MAQRRDREENNNSKKNDAPTQAVVNRMKSDWPKFSSNILSSPSHQNQLTDILLNQHDKPHRNSSVEWWYINGHVQNPANPSANMSFFAAFFRLHHSSPTSLKADAATTQADRDKIIDSDRLSAITWAVTNHTDKSYRPFAFVDDKTPKSMLEAIKLGVWQGNPHLKQALTEVFQKNRIPAPDQLFSKPVTCDPTKLDVQMEGNYFKEIGVCKETGKKQYELHLEGTDEKGSISIDCVVQPDKCPLLHGQNGIVAIDHDNEGPEDMFYYFVPRCSFTGSFTTNNDASTRQSIKGLSWYDHEFGSGIPTSTEELEAAVLRPQKQRDGKEFSWEWAAIQLVEGAGDMEVSAVRLTSGDTLLDFFVIVREGNDASNPQYRLEGKDLEFFPVDEPDTKFTSHRTSLTFSTKWKLRFKSKVSGGQVDLTLAANTIDQEFVTLAAKPSFWEGHMAVGGSWNGKTVKGEGYLECRGATGGSVDQLFDILHAVFCMPLRYSAGTIKNSSSNGSSSPEGYRDFITAEVDKSLAASPPGTAAQFNADPDLKKLLVSIACAYLHLVKVGKNYRGITLDWIEDQFTAHPSFSNPPFHLILLRAFALREVDIATGMIPEPLGDQTNDSAVQEDSATASSTENNNNNNPLQSTVNPAVNAKNYQAVLDRASKVLKFTVKPFTVPADIAVACNTPPSMKTINTCRELFVGQWQLCKDRSESTSSVMAAQGVNIFVRNITDRLAPVLNTTVEVEGASTVKIISDVKTAISSSVSTTVTGHGQKWFSQGRGELTSDSCLQDEGRTLYSRTFIPPNQRKSVEHKWMRVEEEFDDGDAKTIRRCIEMYRFDPDGVENENTLYACRLFLTKKD